jgi:excisionase family DNA binding protein
MGTGIKNRLINQQDIKAQRISNPPRGLSKRLYNIKEGAVYLGRTVWAVREMLWAGKMPYVKDGKRILLDIQDMNEWIDKSKTRSIY